MITGTKKALRLLMQGQFYRQLFYLHSMLFVVSLITPGKTMIYFTSDNTLDCLSETKSTVQTFKTNYIIINIWKKTLVFGRIRALKTYVARYKNRINTMDE